MLRLSLLSSQTAAPLLLLRLMKAFLNIRSCSVQSSHGVSFPKYCVGNLISGRSGGVYWNEYIDEVSLNTRRIGVLYVVELVEGE
jgi:hypothetical protein